MFLYLLFAYAFFTFTIWGVKKTISIPEYQNLCEELRKARQEAGLLQAGLAKKLRKPQSFVSRVEDGQRRLDIFEFLFYTRAINLDPYQLLRSMEELQETNRSNKLSNRKKTTRQKKTSK